MQTLMTLSLTLLGTFLQTKQAIALLTETCVTRHDDELAAAASFPHNLLPLHQGLRLQSEGAHLDGKASSTTIPFSSRPGMGFSLQQRLHLIPKPHVACAGFCPLRISLSQVGLQLTNLCCSSSQALIMQAVIICMVMWK